MYSNLVVKTTSVLNEFHLKMDFVFWWVKHRRQMFCLFKS